MVKRHYKSCHRNLSNNEEAKGEDEQICFSSILKISVHIDAHCCCGFSVKSDFRIESIDLSSLFSLTLEYLHYDSCRPSTNKVKTTGNMTPHCQRRTMGMCLFLGRLKLNHAAIKTSKFYVFRNLLTHEVFTWRISHDPAAQCHKKVCQYIGSPIIYS